MNLRTAEEDLRSVFKKYGPIEKIVVVRDRLENKSRGYAFITFENTDDAKDAREMNGKYLDDNQLRVDFSTTRGPHRPTPGKYMGVPIRHYPAARPERERYSRSRSPAARRSRSRSPSRRDRDRHRGSRSPRRS